MLSVNYGNANVAQTDLKLNLEFLAFTALDIKDTASVCPVRMIFSFSSIIFNTFKKKIVLRLVYYYNYI